MIRKEFSRFKREECITGPIAVLSVFGLGICTNEMFPLEFLKSSSVVIGYIKEDKSKKTFCICFSLDMKQ